MESNDEEKIRATILYHLRRKKVIGGVHTSFDTIKKGFPSHLGKEVEKTCEKLIKENLILPKPAQYGLQVSLNKEKLKEIEVIIERCLGIKFN
ncbi:hypothetical protein HYU07_04745 [Candidatus Woesearchaeota archaeon]|nr:hypothetical protein [Candidatus Woesearchaeota archaeon]